VMKQQPSGLDELLRLVRSSPFDLQYTSHQLLPLLGAYCVLAHYVACGYWAVVLEAVPPFISDYGVTYLPLGRVGNVTEGLSDLGLNASAVQGNYIQPWTDIGRVEALVENSEWMPGTAYLQYGNMLKWYLRSLYFAVCNLTGLGKSPVPLKNSALVFTVLTFISGVLVFAYITSSIVTLVMNSNAPYVRFQSKKNSLLGFMGDAHVDPHVQSRAGKWMDHWWFAHGGIPAGKVIDELPPSLREEIRYRVFQKTTQNSRIFLPLWQQDKKKCLKRQATAAPGKLCGQANCGAAKVGKGSRQEAAVAPVEDTDKTQRDMIARELVLNMNFEVYNAGEWVLHKGMLNETFYIVTVGTAEVLLVEDMDDEGSAPHGKSRLTRCTGRQTRTTQGMRGASNYLHLAGQIIAELEVGEVFGEISSMYRNKCEASVRAKTPLEVITIPRHIMMRALHRSNPLLQRVLGTIRKRRKENDYFKLGKTSFGSTTIAKMAAHKLGVWIRKKCESKKQGRLSTSSTSSGSHGGVGVGWPTLSPSAATSSASRGLTAPSAAVTSLDA